VSPELISVLFVTKQYNAHPFYIIKVNGASTIGILYVNGGFWILLIPAIQFFHAVIIADRGECDENGKTADC
jgi:hypothetical protein